MKMYPVSRGVLRFLLMVVAVSGLGARAAHAIQTSGSIVLVPQQSTLIQPNQEFSVSVYFRNTSTLTPPPPAIPPANPIVPVAPGDPIQARLSGPISVDYACLEDCDCDDENTTDLSFLGCDLTRGVAVGCAPGAAGEVLIELPQGGLNLDPVDTPVLLATLVLRNNVQAPDNLPEHFLRATTGTCALEACELPGTDCVECAAEGCTKVEGGTPIETPFGCRHDCDNEINFYTEPKQDYLKVQGTVQQTGYDPETMPFAVKITKDGAEIFARSEPSLPKVSNQNGGIYLLDGPSNDPNTPGLVMIKVSRRTGTGSGGEDCTMDWFKIVVEARGDFNVAQVVNPKIRIEFTLGQKTYALEETWQSIIRQGNVTTIRFNNKNFAPC